MHISVSVRRYADMEVCSMKVCLCIYVDICVCVYVYMFVALIGFEAQLFHSAAWLWSLPLQPHRGT